MKLIELPRTAVLLISAGTALWVAGCSRSEDDGLAVATTPQAAASQLETAFETAPEATRAAAIAAAAALRRKDYEKAIVSLEAARAGGEVTMQQGVAVHSSVVALEAELIAAAQNGDVKAQQAYRLLKAIKSK
jgi:lipopolysaccharide biosynthesis regulator YciM